MLSLGSIQYFSIKMKLLNLSTIKLVTFDVTGTLLKFRHPPVEVYIEAGRERGVHVTDKETMSKSFKTQWTRLNTDRPHYGTSWRDWWTDFVVATFQVRILCCIVVLCDCEGAAELCSSILWSESWNFPSKTEISARGTAEIDNLCSPFDRTSNFGLGITGCESGLGILLPFT